MVVAIGLLAIIGFAGPVTQVRLTKNDRLIENNITVVSSAINEYARENDSLPSDLNTLDLKDDAKILVNKNLVTYKPNTRQPKAVTDTYNYSQSDDRTIKNFYYELCTEYKKASESSYYESSSSRDGGYSTYPINYQHEAGPVCYKIVTDQY